MLTKIVLNSNKLKNKRETSYVLIYLKRILISVLLGVGLSFLIVTFRKSSDAVPQRINSIESVIVLAGNPDEDRLRVRYGIQIYELYNASYLIFPFRKYFQWEWIRKDYEINISIPTRQILVGESRMKDLIKKDQYGGTYLEAQNALEILKQYSIQTAVVVSSAYHLPRAKMAFLRVFKGADVSLVFKACPNRPISNVSDLLFDRIPGFFEEFLKFLCAFFVYPITEEI